MFETTIIFYCNSFDKKLHSKHVLFLENKHLNAPSDPQCIVTKLRSRNIQDNVYKKNAFINLF